MLTQNNQLMSHILQQFFLNGDPSRQAQGQFSRTKDSLVYCFHNNLLEKNWVGGYFAEQVLKMETAGTTEGRGHQRKKCTAY